MFAGWQITRDASRSVEQCRCARLEAMALEQRPGAATDRACCTPVIGDILDPDGAERLARTLKALADPARLRLLSVIGSHEGAEACVCDLVEPIGLTQPTISHHLKVLTDAGLVTRDKRGVWVYYLLVPDAVAHLAEHLSTHLEPAQARWT